MSTTACRVPLARTSHCTTAPRASRAPTALLPRAPRRRRRLIACAQKLATRALLAAHARVTRGTTAGRCRSSVLSAHFNIQINTARAAKALTNGVLHGRRSWKMARVRSVIASATQDRLDPTAGRVRTARWARTRRPPGRRCVMLARIGRRHTELRERLR